MVPSAHVISQRTGRGGMPAVLCGYVSEEYQHSLQQNTIPRKRQTCAEVKALPLLLASVGLITSDHSSEMSYAYSRRMPERNVLSI